MSDRFQIPPLQPQGSIVIHNNEEAAQAISQLFNLSEVESAEFLTPRPPNTMTPRPLNTLLDVVGSPMGGFGDTAPAAADMSGMFSPYQTLQDVEGSPQYESTPRNNVNTPRNVNNNNNNNNNATDDNQICYDFTKGKCGRGDKCKYSHDIATIVQFNSKEQGICFDYLRGQCDRGLLCKFSHDLQNISHLYQQASNGEVGNVNSTSICYNFLKGVCSKGNSCRYSHDLRVVTGPLPPQVPLTSSASMSAAAAPPPAAAAAAASTTNPSLNAGDAALALLQLLKGDESTNTVASPNQDAATASRPPSVPKLPFTPDIVDSIAKETLQSPTDVLTQALAQNSPEVVQQLYQQQTFQDLSTPFQSHGRSLSAGLDLDKLMDQLTILQELTKAGMSLDDIRQAIDIIQLSSSLSTPQQSNNQSLPRTTSGSVRPSQSQDMDRMYSQPIERSVIDSISNIWGVNNQNSPTL